MTGCSALATSYFDLSWAELNINITIEGWGECDFKIALAETGSILEATYPAGPVFSYKLRYIVGFWLVEMAISTNQKPTIYRNLYENGHLNQSEAYDIS